MTLFSAPKCPQCHRVRIVLAEKGIAHEVVELDPNNLPGELLELNPYGTLPTLVDRELVLYGVNIISEYIDERFPHPPLMPVDPVTRAQTRLALHRIESDWYSLLNDLDFGGEKKVSRARKLLRESLIASVDLFAAKPYFLSDEFSLLDCAVLPVLWRLAYYGIDMPPEAKPVVAYSNRMFSRTAFQEGLTEAERDMQV